LSTNAGLPRRDHPFGHGVELGEQPFAPAFVRRVDHRSELAEAVVAVEAFEEFQQAINRRYLAGRRQGRQRRRHPLPPQDLQACVIAPRRNPAPPEFVVQQRLNPLARQAFAVGNRFDRTSGGKRRDDCLSSPSARGFARANRRVGWRHGAFLR
jgi:hypothetical protein